jgi:hypothetical protein
MPRVQEQQENGIVSSLHYALTDSQCNKCGAQLEWKAEFNDINSPKYRAKHCNQDYVITVDSVRVEMIKNNNKQQSAEQTQDKGEETIVSSISEGRQGGTGSGNEIHQQNQEQPNALTMAQLLKDKERLQTKTKLGDGSNIKAEDR